MCLCREEDTYATMRIMLRVMDGAEGFSTDLPWGGKEQTRRIDEAECLWHENARTATSISKSSAAACMYEPFDLSDVRVP